MDLLRLNKLAEAQRLMGELTREKVTKALRAEEVDEDDVLAQKKAAAAADEAAPAESLEDLLTQERVLRRVGFLEEVHEVQKSIDSTREAESRKQAESESRFLKQRMLGLEMRQRQRIAETHGRHEAEMGAAMRACQGEYDDLLARQAEETHELLETVTAMISLGQGWSMPAVAGAPPWLASIRKHRFRPSRKLTELQATVAKLGEIGETTGGRSNARHEAAVEAAAALERSERDGWKANLMRMALGSDGHSLSSQLLASQKLAQTKMADHHTQKLRVLQKTHAVAATTLDGQFRLEKLNLIEGAKQQRRKAEARAAEEHARLRQSLREAGEALALNAAGGRAVDGGGTSELDASWEMPPPPSAGGSSSSSSAAEVRTELDTEATLRRLRWLEPSAGALRGILRPATSRALFAEFLTAADKRARVQLTFWEQVQACRAIRDPMARATEALALHELHRAVASGPSGVQVDSTEAITHLEAAAERALAKLQSGWLAGFLASSAGVRLMADVAAGTEADYSALPTVSGATWLEQFESAVEGLPFACCAADMQQPGARLGVNASPATAATSPSDATAASCRAPTPSRRRCNNWSRRCATRGRRGRAHQLPPRRQRVPQRAGGAPGARLRRVPSLALLADAASLMREEASSATASGGCCPGASADAQPPAFINGGDGASRPRSGRSCAAPRRATTDDGHDPEGGAATLDDGSQLASRVAGGAGDGDGGRSRVSKAASCKAALASEHGTVDASAPSHRGTCCLP